MVEYEKPKERVSLNLFDPNPIYSPLSENSLLLITSDSTLAMPNKQPLSIPQGSVSNTSHIRD
jgi:hypothetical protein